MLSHRRSWRWQQADSELSERDRQFYRKRYLRRMPIAGMLILLGILIGAGDLLLPVQKNRPLLVTLYWIGVLMLTGLVILQALGDWWQTAQHVSSDFLQVRNKRR